TSERRRSISVFLRPCTRPHALASLDCARPSIEVSICMRPSIRGILAARVGPCLPPQHPDRRRRALQCAPLPRAARTTPCRRRPPPLYHCDVRRTAIGLAHCRAKTLLLSRRLGRPMPLRASASTNWTLPRLPVGEQPVSHPAKRSLAALEVQMAAWFTRPVDRSIRRKNSFWF